MSNRLEVLQASLIKKEALLAEKLDTHFKTVAEANGQPLNDKRNGQATLNKWEKQNDSIRRAMAEVEKTKQAIEAEQLKIAGVNITNEILPKELLDLVASGVLIQWRKFPNTFFVEGVDKGRMMWDSKKKLLYNRYYNDIPTLEQKTKFREVYNSLHSILNKK
jgi:hypothetical protein